MVFYCHVPTCDNNERENKNVSFHEIPSVYERRISWLKEIEKYYPNLKVHDRWKICSVHFRPECFRTDAKNRVLLKRGSVPTIFKPWIEDYGRPRKRGRKSKKTRGQKCKKESGENDNKSNVQVLKVDGENEPESGNIEVLTLKPRKKFTHSKEFTALVFLPQSSEPTVPLGSTVVYGPSPQSRFYKSERERVAIEKEVEEWPDVSVYLADPIDLDIVPQNLDPATKSFIESPVPLPEPEANIPIDHETKKMIAKQKMKGGTFSDLSRLKDDHLYTLPPGHEIRERLEGALERVECLEKEVKSHEQAKKRLTMNFNKTIKEANEYRKRSREKMTENTRLRSEAQQLQMNLSELNLMREMSQSSIPIQLARRLIRQKQMSFSHLCDKFTEETRQFAKTLYEISPKAFRYVRTMFDNALPHPAIVRKWVGNPKSEQDDEMIPNQECELPSKRSMKVGKNLDGRKAKRMKQQTFSMPANDTFLVNVDEIQDPNQVQIQHILIDDRETICQNYDTENETFTVVDIY